MDKHTQGILELLERDGPRLHALLVRLTLSEDIAQELMQDLFVKLYESRQFRWATNRAGYAYRAAVHLAFDWRRQRKRRGPMATLACDPPAEGTSVLERLVDAEEIEQILDAVNELDEPYREAFVMRWIEQKPYEAIAPQLARTPHQVRGLCHKALQQLRAWFAGKPRKSQGKEDCHAGH